MVFGTGLRNGLRLGMDVMMCRFVVIRYFGWVGRMTHCIVPRIDSCSRLCWLIRRTSLVQLFMLKLRRHPCSNSRSVFRSMASREEYRIGPHLVVTHVTATMIEEYITRFSACSNLICRHYTESGRNEMHLRKYILQVETLIDTTNSGLHSL
jgi:hypothetical protein